MIQGLKILGYFLWVTGDLVGFFRIIDELGELSYFLRYCSFGIAHTTIKLFYYCFKLQI